MEKKSILFVCIHNSARSQMAEAFLQTLAGDRFYAYSAGIELPGKLNPFAVQAMKEVGIDISRQRVKSIAEFLLEKYQFYRVITVCDESAGRCPSWIGMGEMLPWRFDDPSAVKGGDREKLAKARAVRDQIRAKIVEWLREFH